jgi:hypothetical protein
MLRALVVGDAVGVLDDAAAALEMFEPDAVAACNNMIIHWQDRLDYAVSLHPNKCSNWVGLAKAIEQREAAGLNRPEVWAHLPHHAVDRHTKDWGGSSGLLTVKVLLEEGFDRIVLAGVPLNSHGAHFYAPNELWRTAVQFRKAWNAHLGELRGKVKSMRGWTRELLGEPTREWLAGDGS